MLDKMLQKQGYMHFNRHQLRQVLKRQNMTQSGSTDGVLYELLKQ